MGDAHGRCQPQLPESRTNKQGSCPWGPRLRSWLRLGRKTSRVISPSALSAPREGGGRAGGAWLSSEGQGTGSCLPLARCSFKQDGGLLKYQQLKVLRVTVRPGGGIPEDVILPFRGL